MSVVRRWTDCPPAHRQPMDLAELERRWSHLHGGDAQPWPHDPALLEGWHRFHEGAFETAAELGHAAGAAGFVLACKATCAHAVLVEPDEATRLARLRAVADQAAARRAEAPQDPAACYWEGHALGRYSQGVSVARALATGLGARIKGALERAIVLAPDHADAHLALATFHAEVIDKVGELIGGMTHGARRDTGLSLYARALALRPDALTTLHECAAGHLMLDGEQGRATASRLRAQAAALTPMDAMERLYLAMVEADLAG